MRKIIELDDVFKTGELTVQLVLPLRHGRLDAGRVTKHASEALDYIKNVAPEPGKTHLLLIAMGGEETYGPNRNGDGFSEFPVPARKGGDRWWVAPGQELTKHYRSFETNPAHAFQHHQNKDPSKASGHVKKAFWNPRMHRVELLTLIDNEKDAEWIERVEAGEHPAVSMGCRIKYDVCSQCGNKAPTRADYCKHAQLMNMINPDGTKNFVYNPDPDFFDISRVFRPADRIGYTMKKVADSIEVRLSADLGTQVDVAVAKIAAARKLSEMDKTIRGEPVATSALSAGEKTLVVKFRDHAKNKLAASPSLPTSVLQSHGLRSVVTAATRRAVVLKEAEFAECAVSRLLGRPANVSSPIVAKLAEAASAAIELFGESPALLDWVLDECKLAEIDHVPDSLDEAVREIAEKRAYAGDLLYRRLVPEGVGVRSYEAPTTDLLHVGDHVTTRGAAIDAQDAVTRAHMRKVLGGTALLLGGYKMLTAYPWMRRMKMPLAVGAGALGHAALSPRPEGTLRADEGLEIPDITEMAPKTAAIVHMVEHARLATRPHDLSRAKTGARVDPMVGLVLDVGAVADCLGAIVAT